LVSSTINFKVYFHVQQIEITGYLFHTNLTNKTIHPSNINKHSCCYLFEYTNVFKCYNVMTSLCYEVSNQTVSNLECVRAPVGSNKRIDNCFSISTIIKSRECLSWNQDNVSEWSDMSICGLLFHWSTLYIFHLTIRSFLI
jgi:hypothetical protein